MRQAVQEVRRPVERIDDPAPGRVGALDRLGFLAHPAIGRARAHQFIADDLFRLGIGAADEIARPLDRDLKVLDLAEILHEAERPALRAALIIRLRLALPCIGHHSGGSGGGYTRGNPRCEAQFSPPAAP